MAGTPRQVLRSKWTLRAFALGQWQEERGQMSERGVEGFGPYLGWSGVREGGLQAEGDWRQCLKPEPTVKA